MANPEWNTPTCPELDEFCNPPSPQTHSVATNASLFDNNWFYIRRPDGEVVAYAKTKPLANFIRQQLDGLANA